jgi:hypothetical protein
MECAKADPVTIDLDFVPVLPPEYRITMTDLFAISRMSGVDSRVFIEGAFGLLEDLRSGNV